MNRIVKSEGLLRAGDWLRPTQDLPESLLSSEDHYFARIETSPAKGHLRLITLANEVAGPEWPHGAIILDIDRISIEHFEPTFDELSKKLASLHEDVWKAFDAAGSENLKKALNGLLS